MAWRRTKSSGYLLLSSDKGADKVGEVLVGSARGSSIGWSRTTHLALVLGDRELDGEGLSGTVTASDGGGTVRGATHDLVVGVDVPVGVS